MLHLTRGTSFLLLFVFLVNSILNHHRALLHLHALILDHLTLAFHVVFSTLVLKLSFSQSLSFHSHLSLPQADLLELLPVVVWRSLAAVVLVNAQSRAEIYFKCALRTIIYA